MLRSAWLLAGGDWALAEDLAQTALGEVWRHWDRVARLDVPDAYAHKVADPSAKPGTTAAVPALPASVPTSAPRVTYSIKSAANVTVADVITKAATAVGSQANPGAGWPAGAYGHTEQQVMSGGKLVSRDNIWTDASGNGVGEGTDDPPYAIGSGGQLPAVIGGKGYTWAQLDALPTDPAKLWPIVKADERLPFSSDPALPKSGSPISSSRSGTWLPASRFPPGCGRRCTR